MWSPSRGSTGCMMTWTESESGIWFRTLLRGRIRRPRWPRGPRRRRPRPRKRTRLKSRSKWPSATRSARRDRESPWTAAEPLSSPPTRPLSPTSSMAAPSEPNVSTQTLAATAPPTPAPTTSTTWSNMPPTAAAARVSTSPKPLPIFWSKSQCNWLRFATTTWKRHPHPFHPRERNEFLHHRHRLLLRLLHSTQTSLWLRLCPAVPHLPLLLPCLQDWNVSTANRLLLLLLQATFLQLCPPLQILQSLWL